MLEEDMALKNAVHYTNPELDRCLKLADEIKGMAITPLMLKKHPDIVTTVRKMRRYVGPVEPSPGFEVVLTFFDLSTLYTYIFLFFHLGYPRNDWQSSPKGRWTL